MGTPLSTTQWTSLGPAPVNNGAGSLLVSGRIEGVAPHPTITGRFFVAGQNGGIWQTNDGGTTWTALTDSQPSLEFNELAQPAVQSRERRHHHRRRRVAGRWTLISQDGGVTWQHQPITGPVTIRKASFSMRPIRRRSYCANGWNGFYKSTNLGSSWTKLNLPGGYFADVLMMPSGTLYTVLLGASDATKNGIHYSVDGGAHSKQSASTALPSGAALGNGSGGRSPADVTTT